MRMHKLKDGRWISRKSEHHWFPVQQTQPGDPLNNHCPRMGTKRKAGARYCDCEYCRGVQKKLIEKKIRNKDMQDQIEETE